ncbi:MAG: extracellular solute-binding protein [Spirochaetaceae bacterium]|nr:MAG: extracellular solute-binding protein [Spirochaetaceae bacterium]
MKRLIAGFVCIGLITLAPGIVFGAGGRQQQTQDVTFFHYFSGSLAGGIEDLVSEFNRDNPGFRLSHSPLDHEAFKTSIRVMLSGGNPPDLFSYWAGAQVQFLVDADRLEPVDDVYREFGLDDLFSDAVLQGTEYNGRKYFLPLTQHFVAFFYNKAAFDQAGVTPPETWDEFLAVCEALKNAGITPIALGSRERWPAQFWLDYPLLRTAGPQYRADLMAGSASYTDPEVVRAFEMWKLLIDRGYFVENANAYDWAEAATMVGTGQAAMTLMGTWFMQLDDQIGWVAGEDYDFFPFPVVDPSVANVAVGPIDGVVLARDARSKDIARKVLGELAAVGPQTTFNRGSGALAPNRHVSSDIYNVLQLKVQDYLRGVPNWAFNYDLATPPPVADVGLDAFSEFMAKPGEYQRILRETEAGKIRGLQETEL